MGPPPEHIELLSLPRRAVMKAPPLSSRTGLPINSLPGWEDIPLNCKLPMLKCPGNEVIFSMNKIGQTFKVAKYEFDLSINDNIPEYNPLHDNNLKSFYTTKQNLKRLRDNGEITENNEVICNLKDFNRYRVELHKSRLYLMMQNQNREDLDQRDIKMIEHADSIRSRAYRNLWARAPDIAFRLQQLEEKRQQKCRRMIEKSHEKFSRVDAYRKMQNALLEHKKMINKLNMERHFENYSDINRKKLIHIKKNLQVKKERHRKNLRLYAERRIEAEKEKEIASWEKRLNERLEQQARIKKLLKEAEVKRQIYINNYHTKYRDIWDRTEKMIEQRAIQKMHRAMTKYRPRRKQKQSDKMDSRRSITQEYRETFEKLLDSELCDALNTAINMEENIQVPFMPDDPIYKAATFITQQIIHKYNKDLNCDNVLRKLVAKRLEEYFEEATKFVLFRASQIIFAARAAMKNESFNLGSINCLTCRENRSLSKFVAFSKVSSTIGTSSYSIHPLINVRSVGERKKTPPGSLTSIVLDPRENLIGRSKTDHLEKYDLVFVEHFVIKFKRELVVGMGKRVFAAIRCHYHGKIMDVSQDLLDVESSFLAKQGAEAILGYAHNPINFKSVVRFCVSALSNRLIWSLQQILLKPDRDPRGIVPTTQGCAGQCNFQAGLCLYCGNCMYNPCFPCEDEKKIEEENEDIEQEDEEEE